MRIPLSEFKLPGDPGVDGDVTYTAIDYDVNSGCELDGHITYAYLVSGYREDDGSGVLIHGTKDGGNTVHGWRSARLLQAPSDPEGGITVTKTEFHGVESLIGHQVRLVGCVKTEEGGDSPTGFMYEGLHDGSGDWYPLRIDGESGCVAKASKDGAIVCSVEDPDLAYVYSLEFHTWEKLRVGYSDEWTVDEIIPAGHIYVIRLLHSDGKRSDLSYSPGK